MVRRVEIDAVPACPTSVYYISQLHLSSSPSYFSITIFGDKEDKRDDWIDLRKPMINHDPTRTRLFGKLQRLRLPCALILHADIRQLAEIACAFTIFVAYVANEHAETGLEGGYFAGLCCVEERVRHIVYHLLRG
jgi:hypothetical protein